MNRKEIAIGDVYYAEVECNGSVQGEFRPYVVMQNDIGNKYSPNVVLIPLTTAIKKEKMPTHTKGKEAMFMPKPCRSFEKKRRRLNKTFETGLTMTQETSQSLN